MYETYWGGMTVHINLQPGIYALDLDSGTGKTYMYEILSSVVACGEPVVTMRYVGRPNEAISVIGAVSDDTQIVMVDRCDMFPDDSPELRQAVSAKSAIVLIDLKLMRKDLRGLRIKRVKVNRKAHDIYVG